MAATRRKPAKRKSLARKSGRPPVEVARIDHIVLRVRDVPCAIKFYRQVLGCAVAHRQPKLGLVHLRAGASMIDLITLDGPLGRMGGAAPLKKGRRNLDHFALRVERFDEPALRRHLARFGIDMGQPARRYGAEGEGLSVYFSDPEGNVIELKGPAART
ncbi:MAG: VOC family protein [Rhodospirillales bacterium]|nr:VOC family protein [Rhodospirillales bacterium]